MTRLVFIVGTSAVGKSNWAIEWAKHSLSQGERAGILNCDSIQIYKELNIGSAKPDFSKYPEIPFYLYNQIKAPEVCTAGIFREKAIRLLTKKLPKEWIIATGGSGFYLQALEKGMYPVQSFNTPTKNIPLNKLYQSLKEKDPATALLINPKDRYRISRALYLITKEGKTLSQIKSEFKEQSLPWPYLKIGLRIPKTELLNRVQKRTKKMLKEGLIEEVETLLKKGLKHWRPLNSIGYKETRQYLEGSLTKEELEAVIVSNTMRLTKKQRTWFKKDKNIQWFDWNLPPLKVYKQLFKC